MFNYIRNAVNRVRTVRYAALAAVGVGLYMFFKRGK